MPGRMASLGPVLPREGIRRVPVASGSGSYSAAEASRLASAVSVALAVALSAAVMGATGSTSRASQRRRRGRTALRGTKRTVAARKKRTAIGPKKLKSGFWQEGDEDDDIDIFEWIAAEDLEDEPPAPLLGLQEVAQYSQQEGFPTERFAGPEYRTPERPLQLQKAIKKPPPLDEAVDRWFSRDIVEAVGSYREAPYAFEDLDVVTSLSSLRMLVGFLDGSMTADMRAKGLTTRRRNEPVAIDLMRISRMPEAPKAICLGSVWSWVPANSTASVGALNRQSYDVNFERVATGQQMLSGPPSTRNQDKPLHYRLLEYNCGGLRMLVRAPTAAMAPAVDREELEGQAVQLESVNHRDVADLWGSALPSRYAEMQLADVGMIVRGAVNKGSLMDLQEITREDLRLDRPAVAEDAERLFGRLAGLLRRVRAIADCPGCEDRPLYLQFHDAELRIIAPILEDFSELDDPEDEEVQEVLRYVAGGAPVAAR